MIEQVEKGLAQRGRGGPLSNRCLRQAQASRGALHQDCSKELYDLHLGLAIAALGAVDRQKLGGLADELPRITELSRQLWVIEHLLLEKRGMRNQERLRSPIYAGVLLAILEFTRHFG